jgi:hypothetical protein
MWGTPDRDWVRFAKGKNKSNRRSFNSPSHCKDSLTMTEFELRFVRSHVPKVRMTWGTHSCAELNSVGGGLLCRWEQTLVCRVHALKD